MPKEECVEICIMCGDTEVEYDGHCADCAVQAGLQCVQCGLEMGDAPGYPQICEECDSGEG